MRSTCSHHRTLLEISQIAPLPVMWHEPGTLIGIVRNPQCGTRGPTLVRNLAVHPYYWDKLDTRAIPPTRLRSTILTHTLRSQERIVLARICKNLHDLVGL